MIQQDSSSYSKEDQSKFVDAWESNIEKIEKNRKIMREGRQSANLYRMLGLLSFIIYSLRNCYSYPYWMHTILENLDQSILVTKTSNL